jgi:hypothetical protein
VAKQTQIAGMIAPPAWTSRASKLTLMPCRVDHTPERRGDALVRPARETVQPEELPGQLDVLACANVGRDVREPLVDRRTVASRSGSPSFARGQGLTLTPAGKLE